MARFNFREGFFLNLGGGILTPKRIRFEAGEQDVPDELADHWFLAEMGVRIDVPSDQDGAEEGDAEAPDDRDALRSRAEALGIVVNKRWGVARLAAEIAALESPVPPEPPIHPEATDEQAAL